MAKFKRVAIETEKNRSDFSQSTVAYCELVVKNSCARRYMLQ